MTLIGQCGLMFSGESSTVSANDLPKGVLMLVYLALVSSVAYTLWGLLRSNETTFQRSPFSVL